MGKRIEKWDILKFGLMFFVVLGHLADCYTGESENMRSLYLFIYTFHMPLFIFVSGLFSKRTVNEKRIDKMVGFLLIYIFSKALFGLYDLINIKTFRFNFTNANGLPWFMLAMFAFPLITYLVRNVKPQYVLAVSIAIALLAGYDSKVVDFLAVSRIIVFFPFFYLGYILDPNMLQKVTDKWWIKLLSLMFILFMAFVIFYMGDKIYPVRPLFTGRNPYAVLGTKANLGALLRLGCYIVSVVASFALIALTPNRTPFKFIASFGTRTLAVYVYHYIVIYLLYNQFHIRDYFEKLLPNGGAGFLIIPLAAVITFLLSLKFFSAPVDAILRLPQKALKQKE